jgi:hypothetical protein
MNLARDSLYDFWGNIVVTPGSPEGFTAEFQDHSFEISDRCKVTHLLPKILAGQNLTGKRKRLAEPIYGSFRRKILLGFTLYIQFTANLRIKKWLFDPISSLETE